MNRFTHPLAISLLFVAVFLQPGNAVARDNWISVQSKNFFLIGNGSEKDIKQVAIRLEQFREVFTHLFPKMKFSTPVPTTVVVFKSESSFRPFKPGPNIAGYFQPGPDVNYISLTTELQGDQDPFDVIFHEYTHLLVNNTIGGAPLWFNEGLAEYYSTFNITDDQKFILGRAIGNHVLLLRDSKMLPFKTLFDVDHKSPHYNERNKQSIFYAESWALMHYLIIGKEGRLEQLSKFVDLLGTNVPKEEAFQRAFQTTFEAMEKELRNYVKQDRYKAMEGHFQRKLETDTGMQSAPISEAEAQAYLGDLLLHSNRKDSETYLEKALSLDPNLSLANAAMGMAKLRVGKPRDALVNLERAVKQNSQNYLVHYYYAYALSQQNVSSGEPVNGFSPETATKMHQELLKAIELRPDYPASYSLLGYVSLLTGNNLEETRSLLMRALSTSPGRNDLVFMLAQIYLRKSDYKLAQQLLEQVAKSNAEEETRQNAETLLTQLKTIQQFQERAKQDSSSTVTPPEVVESSPSRQTAQTESVPPTDPSTYLREILRHPAEGETQLQATLVSIECDARGITFVIKSGAQTLRLHTATFDDMEITTYNPDVKGDITCGVRKPENTVIVCFTPQADKRRNTDGVIKSIEFVPANFKLKF